MTPHAVNPSPASTQALLTRIAAALDRLAPPPPPPPDLTAAAFIWHPATTFLRPVARVAHPPLARLHGIDHQKAQLLANTQRFAAGHPALNAMLWGARGMGKSSLVKAVHAACPALALIEIARDDLATLPTLLSLLRQIPRRCLIFCDDLSFEYEDSHYKALKSVLDGGIEGPPATILFYATSNRRHLMPRAMIDNERATAIHPAEASDEKIALSDRFGLWLGFYPCDQPTYLAMIDAYANAAALPITPTDLHAQALEWSTTRGARSGRVAAQFITDLTARLAGPSEDAQ